MKRFNAFSPLLAAALFAGGAVARAETIQQGILSISAAAPGTPVPGTIDTGYVTAIFGKAAFLQDATGAIYDIYGAEAASGGYPAGPFYGLTVGTQFTGLTGGGFELYPNHNQFEYYGNGALAGSTPGLIPVSYFTLTTTSGLINNQGGSDGNTITQGLQSQLVTIDNAMILNPDGTAPMAGATFTSGQYTIMDATGSVTLYISNSLTDVIGQPIPTGKVKISGVFDEYNATTQEVEPRSLSDFAVASSVPEPSTVALCALALVAFGIGITRRRRLA